MADISGAFEVNGLVKQKEALESLMMNNPEMEKRVQKLIRQVLMAARREVAKAAQQPSVMKSDPRQLWFDVGRERDTTAWPIVLNGGLLYMYLHFYFGDRCLFERKYLSLHPLLIITINL